MKLEPNKNHSLHLRLTDEQYSFLAESAEYAGVSPSDFLRMMLNTAVVASKKIENSVKLGEPHADNTNPIERKL